MPKGRWSHVTVAVTLLLLGCSTVPSRPPTPPPAPSSTPAPSASAERSAETSAFPLDALTWQAIAQPFGGGGRQVVEGLFINGSGELVAWGSDEDAEDPSGLNVPTFWTSGDGIGWRETRLGTSADELVVIAVDDGPLGFVAVGFAGSSIAAWSSPNGDSWSDATMEDPATDETTGFRAVAAGAHGFLAVGLDRGHAAAWFSAEGDSWANVGPDFPPGRFEAVAQTTDGGFVVVGIDESGDDWNGAAWVVSGDGHDWRRANATEAIEGPNDDHLRRLWSFAGGYVAFGQELDPDDRTCHTCRFDRNSWRLYSSRDGLAWSRHAIDFEPATGEPVLAEYSALAPWADGLIAVGAGTDREVRVWLSSDGIDWTPQGNSISLGAFSDGEPTVDALVVADRQLVIGGYLLTDDGYLMIGTAPPPTT